MNSPEFTYSTKWLGSFLDGIYDGSITEYELSEPLYYDIVAYLKSGLYKGFGGKLTDFVGQDLELLEELRNNVYMFSAAKTYQQTKEIQSMMINEAGELRSSKEFTELGKATFEQWNVDWGRTERNTAEGMAQQASKWNEIEKNKDLLPILEYSTSGGDACDICVPLDGMTAEVDDPIWDSVAPLNHFNCECVLLQHEEGKALTPDAEKEATIDTVHGNMSDTFMMNAGKDRVIFSENHPYFDVPKKDIPFAKENFGLPIPSEDEE